MLLEDDIGSGMGSSRASLSRSGFLLEFVQNPVFHRITEAGYARVDHDQPERAEPEPRFTNAFGACSLERDAQAQSDQGQAGGGEDHPFAFVGHARDSEACLTSLQSLELSTVCNMLKHEHHSDAGAGRTARGFVCFDG
jgi:hypothetical protein